MKINYASTSNLLNAKKLKRILIFNLFIKKLSLQKICFLLKCFISIMLVLVVLWKFQNISTSIWYLQDSRIVYDDYLIDTKVCQLQDWAIFDKETYPLYTNYTDQVFLCNKHSRVKVRRVNFTWVSIEIIDGSSFDQWNCTAFEIIRKSFEDTYTYGAYLNRIGALHNFAHNMTTEQLSEADYGWWDSVEIQCTIQYTKIEYYTHVIPLIQRYKVIEAAPRPKINVMLLGIDSISRINFLRHFVRTKELLDKHGFIPLLGYHKVGENSFPNILPMFTGKLESDIKNVDINTKFDQFDFIFKKFNRHGYLTTFIEDMPPYGFFTYGKGGFRKQPTNYYLRPTNLAIWDQLYNYYVCYWDKTEHEVYFEYLLDLFRWFRINNQAHFTFAHLSTLTHNYLNFAGYADTIYSKFLKRLLDENFNENTVILLYSDHGIRMGDIANTYSGIFEQRLPFFYIYVPDSLKLGQMDAAQLRQVVLSNQHKLTSHIDLHATMLHVLHGQPPQNEPYGVSLFTEIPSNRTCEKAGIPNKFCLCNSFKRIYLSYAPKIAQTLVDNINRKLIPFNDECANLSLSRVDRVLIRPNELKPSISDLLIQIKTSPNNGIFESILHVDHKNPSKVYSFSSISRLDMYGDQSQCVTNIPSIEPFCYCVDND